jgi:hypothetical protein
VLCSRNQQALIAALMAENDKLATLPHWHNIAEVVRNSPTFTGVWPEPNSRLYVCRLDQMGKAPTYHQRLHNMRTQMVDLSSRVQRLKTRSAKLRQRKVGVEEKERQLTAQPAESLLKRRAGSGGAATAPAALYGDSKAASAKGKERA